MLTATRWETYPVPHTAPPPYNDQASWGIVPAWGYATVTESSVPGIAPDSVIWGYWPTSTSPTLLRLEPSDLQGHWVEVSSHRQQLMPIYNRYEQILPENEEPDEMAWGALLRGVWIAGYLLSEYVFSPDPRARVPVRPLGAASKLPWSAGDADLSSAVVVVLAASTKTARSILWCLFNRPRESGPLGLVQVTSSPAALQKVASKKGWGDVSKSLAYTEIHQATRWIEGRQPSKVVIIDCGARDHVLSQLYKSLQVSALQPCKTVIIQLGSQQKVGLCLYFFIRCPSLTTSSGVYNGGDPDSSCRYAINGEDTVQRLWRSGHTHRPGWGCNLFRKNLAQLEGLVSRS